MMPNEKHRPEGRRRHKEPGEVTVNRPKSTTRTGNGNGNSPRAWAYGDDHARATIAAHRLYHHAVKCDTDGNWQMARIMWAKYAEAASATERKHPTGLMKFTHQRLF